MKDAVATIFLLVLLIGVSWGAPNIPEQFSPSLPSSAQPGVRGGLRVLLDNTPAPSPTPAPLPPLPLQHTLVGGTHSFQTFNNCGPAALSMALSHLGISETQQVLGRELRPYQVANGDNDDKSTTLEELATKAQEYGLSSYHRPAGSIELLKRAVALDLPVIARTLLTVNDDIGHYRVVKGYDEIRGVLLQDDSLQGKDLEYEYDEFLALWQQFNYEYLILAPADNVEDVELILGEHLDTRTAWESARGIAVDALAKNPADLYARLNLSVALHHLGEHQQAVAEFEKVETRLPFRTMWYQIEPIESYFELGHYDRVIQLTDQILTNHNRAFSELYLIRGNVYEKQGRPDQARSEYQNAVLYNDSNPIFQQALDNLESR